MEYLLKIILLNILRFTFTLYGDWGLGPIPNPQSPIPNPQSPIPNNNLWNKDFLNFN